MGDEERQQILKLQDQLGGPNGVFAFIARTEERLKNIELRWNILTTAVTTAIIGLASSGIIGLIVWAIKTGGQ